MSASTTRWLRFILNYRSIFRHTLHDLAKQQVLDVFIPPNTPKTCIHFKTCAHVSTIERAMFFYIKVNASI